MKPFRFLCLHHGGKTTVWNCWLKVTEWGPLSVKSKCSFGKWYTRKISLKGFYVYIVVRVLKDLWISLSQYRQFLKKIRIKLTFSGCPSKPPIHRLMFLARPLRGHVSLDVKICIEYWFHGGLRLFPKVWNENVAPCHGLYGNSGTSTKTIIIWL